MKHLRNPSPEEVTENMVDVTEADYIEVLTDGKTVWVNINGACLLRVCKIATLEFNTTGDYGC